MKTICDELYQYCIDWGCIHYGEPPPGIPITPKERRDLAELTLKDHPWDISEIIQHNMFLGIHLDVLMDGATRRAQIAEKSKQFKKNPSTPTQSAAAS